MRADETFEHKKNMNINHIKRNPLISAAIITCALLLFGNNVLADQKEDIPKPPERSEKQYRGSQKHETIKGYPVRDRQMGGPTDVQWDLDNSFPKRDSVWELMLRCRDHKK